jgi:hypothetical protein
VLATGVLASLAAIALLSYPGVRDLLQLDVWSVTAVGIPAGAARGQFMRMESDHNWGLVRLTWAHDWLWVSIAVLLFAILQFAIEIRLRQQNPFETTVELPRDHGGVAHGAGQRSSARRLDRRLVPRRLDRPH